MNLSYDEKGRVALSFLLILMIFISLLASLMAAELLSPLIALLLPLAITLAAYRLFFASKRPITAAKRLHMEATLLNRLSIKQNDLSCQKRWLKQLSADDDSRCVHLAAYKKLRREIRLLEKQLSALRRED